MEKKALGKGLQALLPEKKNVAWKIEQDIQMVDLSSVYPNRYQPRTVFSEEELEELSQSIKEHGVLQPIVVRRKGDGMFELIAGERRTRAAKKAGLSAIPAIIRNSNDEKSLALALIENIQRQNLNPMEEARALSRLVNEFGLTQDLVAQSVGKERSTIANLLRLVALPKQVQGHIQSGALSLGHAKILAGLSSETQQCQLASRAVENSLSVRQLELLIGSRKSGKTVSVKVERNRPYRNLEDQIRKRLGTKVQIKGGERGGQMIIHYFSSEDLDRISSMMLE